MFLFPRRKVRGLVTQRHELGGRRFTAPAAIFIGQHQEVQAAAKRRLADEYDAAQDRGEVGKQGQRTDLLPNEEKVPTPADVGLSYKEIHEARQIRDAEVASPGIVRLSN